MARVIENEGSEYEVSAGLVDRLRRGGYINSCPLCSSASRTVYHMSEGNEFSRIEQQVEQDMASQSPQETEERKTDWVAGLTNEVIKAVEEGNVEKAQSYCSQLRSYAVAEASIGRDM